MSAADLRLIGVQESGCIYEVTAYKWWDKRQGSSQEIAHKFASKRMALLYAAKGNSDGLLSFATSEGRNWTDLFPGGGPYAVTPNKPFCLNEFLDLSDDALKAYADSVGSALNRHKPPSGTMYLVARRQIETTSPEELLKLLGSEHAA